MKRLLPGGGGVGVVWLGEKSGKCGICLELEVLPTETPCGHHFCYYCASQAVVADLFTCPLCDSQCSSSALRHAWQRTEE